MPEVVSSTLSRAKRPRRPGRRASYQGDTLLPKPRIVMLTKCTTHSNYAESESSPTTSVQGQTRAGIRCRACVVGGLEVCIPHSPWRSRGPGSKRPPIRPGRVACRCEAYTWPHRRGSGVCRWPDPPETPCTIPAGTRRSTRLRSIQRAQKLELHQLTKRPKTTLLNFRIPSNRPSFASPE